MSESTTEPTPTCPTCGAAEGQHRAGTNRSGTARRECRRCGRTYTPRPKRRGHDEATRRAALRLYVDGTNFRRIARHLSVSPQTVINWVNASAARLPAPPTPQGRRGEPGVETLEMDELYTFVSQKKSPPTS